VRSDQADRGLQLYAARDAQFVFDGQFEEFGTLVNFGFYIVVNFVIFSLSVAAHRKSLLCPFRAQIEGRRFDCSSIERIQSRE
jgi:hypothetical protein